MYTQDGLGEGVSEWLARTHPAPERVRRDWAEQRVALLPLGERLAAVRIASEIVHAAVQSENRAQVADVLYALLGGAIIYDRRVAGGTYYALVDGRSGSTWVHGDAVTYLGRGTYLGVPRIDQRRGPGTYWVVPPQYEGHLCPPSTVLELVAVGHARLSMKGECRPQYTGEVSTRMSTRGPWALRLVSDRLPVSPPSYATVALDDPTQTARYMDAAGRAVEMGKHGTSRTTGTASVSGGGDGQNPQPQTQDDHTTDYESD